MNRISSVSLINVERYLVILVHMAKALVVAGACSVKVRVSSKIYRQMIIVDIIIAVKLHGITLEPFEILGRRRIIVVGNRSAYKIIKIHCIAIIGYAVINQIFPDGLLYKDVVIKSCITVKDSHKACNLC